MRLTVGPLPPAVYWRRRAFVLGTILLVLFLVAQACMAASASPDRRSAEQPSPTASAPAPPPTGPVTDPDAAPDDSDSDDRADDPAAEDLGEDGCTDEEMLIEARAERTSLPVGTSVEFTIMFRNDSDRLCLRDIGADLRELALRRGSGAAWVWSSRDCNDLRGRDVQELSPGIDNTHWIVWNGRASDSCEQTEPAGEVLPPGEYELVARLGTAHSEPLPITLTEAS